MPIFNVKLCLWFFLHKVNRVTEHK